IRNRIVDRFAVGEFPTEWLDVGIANGGGCEGQRIGVTDRTEHRWWRAFGIGPQEPRARRGAVDEQLTVTSLEVRRPQTDDGPRGFVGPERFDDFVTGDA